MTADTPTDELIRRRFHELAAAVEAIRSRSAPVRAEYEARMKEIQALEAKVRDDIVPRLKKAEAGLFEAMNEHAQAARALRKPGELVSKTGEPSATE